MGSNLLPWVEIHLTPLIGIESDNHNTGFCTQVFQHFKVVDEKCKVK